jgi:hypothetical protein
MQRADAFCLSSLLANSELAALPKWKLFHQLSAFTVSYVLHSLLVWCM